ncbi:MAG TPA: diacylglycerol kinase [Gemmobacter sp.]|nr:diacylglycerol kinase [Gemmobacter sp.]
MSDERKVVPPRKGLLHLVDAAGYSLQGLRRLMRESAARHEVLAGLLGVAALGLRGASLGQIITFGMLILALLAVEALNTALEEVVDHLSPGWSEMAKNAKDLGSLAVGLVVVIVGVQFGWAMLCPA